MFEDGLGKVGKDILAFISGIGLFSIGLFFYFFMLEDAYEKIYLLCAIAIAFSALMVLFFLLDDLEAVYAWAMMRDETGDFKEKLRRWSNLVSGMFLMALVGIILVAFTSSAYSFDHGIRLLTITLLTSFSVFLFLFSLFMD